jgi:uncharacterized protein YceK
MLRIKVIALTVTTAFLLSGCFGDTDTHRANEGKPDTGASVKMEKEKGQSGDTMSGIPNE